MTTIVWRNSSMGHGLYKWAVNALTLNCQINIPVRLFISCFYVGRYKLIKHTFKISTKFPIS